MSTRQWLVASLACASVASGCTTRIQGRSHDTGLPPAADAGMLLAHDAHLAHDVGHAPDAVVVPYRDSGPGLAHDAGSTAHPDTSAITGHDAATLADAWFPALDVGVADAQTVTGATRCWEGETVMQSGVFVGTTCGAIDLVGASCGRPGAPERYFTALGPLAGGHASYAVEVDPPEFVIQELSPTEVGFDCAIIDGACSAAHRVLMGSDITQFMVERGSGGCGSFTLTVGAM